MNLDEGWTTRIGSSRSLTQVQAAAEADHHRRRNDLDRDLGFIMAVILGVEAEGAAEAVTTTKGTLPPIPTPTGRATTASRTLPQLVLR